MTSANSEKSEDTSQIEEETTLRAEMVALRKEIKALKNEITKEKEEVKENPQKLVIRKVLKCYRDTGISKDLDVRRMVITSDRKYLITCSEIQLGKKTESLRVVFR